MFNLEEMCMVAKQSKLDLLNLKDVDKNKLLKRASLDLIRHKEEILQENRKDIEVAENKGMSLAMIDRLRITSERIDAMALGLEQICLLSDPVGEVLDEFERPNGLLIQKIRVPLGVIGIIYESRPNVTVDAFGLCFKSGNVAILKGGSDALFTNRILITILRESLESEGINKNIVQLIDSKSREVTMQFLKMKDYVDVLIPRGGSSLIQSVIENSLIPVIETGTGNCHVYVDDVADIDMAISIILNAKTQRFGVCNACESLVIHEKIAEMLLPKLSKILEENGVEVRADSTSIKWIINGNVANDTDFAKEYLGPKISVKTVSSLDDAIQHINHYNTKHSETIVTNNKNHAERFLREIDASCVYWNASTRFTDGFEFGFGAEIGISTQMLHARGPMGLKELTSYKYNIIGNGQIRC